MDKAHKQTDEILNSMERHLSKIYAKVGKSTRIKLADYLALYKREADSILQKYSETGGETYKKQYQMLVLKATRSKEFKELRSTVSEDIYKANKQSNDYINARMPEVYALNFNYTSDSIKRDISDYEDMNVTAEEANKYGNITKQEINKSKDKKWNAGNVEKAVVAGALVIQPLEEIAKVAARKIAKKNKNSSFLHAQDMATDAESKGRLDSMYRATDLGIEILKKWSATLDNKTRPSHRELDGMTIPLDEEFLPRLSRPRDPNGPPQEIHRCRCTLQHVLPEISTNSHYRVAREGTVKGSYKNPNSFKDTKSIEVESMTYGEWMRQRK